MATNLSNLFTNIANAIREKDGTSELIPAENFPSRILEINSGIDTSLTNGASSSDILSGKSAFVNGNKIDGAMINNGAISKTLTYNGQNYTIPAGYHNGAGTVSVSVPEFDYGEIVADDIATDTLTISGLGFTPNNFILIPITSSYGVVEAGYDMFYNTDSLHTVVPYIAHIDGISYSAYTEPTEPTSVAESSGVLMNYVSSVSVSEVVDEIDIGSNYITIYMNQSEDGMQARLDAKFDHIWIAWE